MSTSLLQPCFIVGTGRCGSTMLSNFLREHPHVLSISELFSLITDFGTRIAQAFPDGPISAQQFWDVLATPYAKQTLLLRHAAVMDEVLYHPGPGRRFSASTGIPAILQTTLPHLSNDPDSLFDELRVFVAGRPPSAISDHYLAVFAWLARRFEKRAWVERSGGSLRIVRRLAQTFPGARFVHLVRDGRDCALSMSRHLGFRMAFVSMQLTEILGIDPFEVDDRRWIGDLPDELIPLLPEHFTGPAFRAYETPAPLCAHYWSGEVMDGLSALASLEAERVLTLRYEDFLTSPGPAIDRLLHFIDPQFNDTAFVERAVKSIRARPSAVSELAPAQRRALEHACKPGFTALADLYTTVS